ncbi:MAG: hypothetical protein II474_06320 [Firmicutes bacterium]|nr:hypothetical protein [Bacillota bacterium]
MKKYGFILIITYAVMSLFVTAGAFATEDMKFSETENRALAQWPGSEIFAMAEETDSSGAADLTAIEDYLCDQFPAREAIVNGYTNALIHSGRWYVRNVRILREGEADDHDGYYFGPEYLFNASFPVNGPMLETLCEELDSFAAEQGIQTVYALIPQKNLALADGSAGLLDDTADRANLQTMKDALQNCAHLAVLDVCTPLLETYGPERRAEMYYKGDFHWNDIGAFRACKILADLLAEKRIVPAGSAPRSSDFVWKDYTGQYVYKADLSKRFGDEMDAEEFMPYYAPEDSSRMAYYLELEGAPLPRGAVVGRAFDPEAAENTLQQAEREALARGEITYGMLATLNLPYIRVENPDARVKKTVVVLKDSYENPCTDYLSMLFTEVNIIDPRFETPLLSEIIQKRRADLLLCLYHQNNVSEDLIRYLQAESEK